MVGTYLLTSTSSKRFHSKLTCLHISTGIRYGLFFCHRLGCFNKIGTFYTYQKELDTVFSVVEALFAASTRWRRLLEGSFPLRS